MFLFYYNNSLCPYRAIEFTAYFTKIIRNIRNNDNNNI